MQRDPLPVLQRIKVIADSRRLLTYKLSDAMATVLYRLSEGWGLAIDPGEKIQPWMMRGGIGSGGDVYAVHHETFESLREQAFIRSGPVVCGVRTFDLQTGIIVELEK